MFGAWSLKRAAPSLWNCLPPSLKSSFPSTGSFKRSLKTHLTYLTYASWFLGEHRAVTTLLNARGFGWSSSSRPMSFRPPSPQRRYSCAKSAWVDPLSAFLADSSPEPAWWRWIQAFVACGRSTPIFVSLFQFQLGLVSSYPTVVHLGWPLATWCWGCFWDICWWMSVAFWCWSWLPATFLNHIVGQTSHWCWISGSCCGVRGLLISRLVARCWRRVLLCWFGTWCLRLSPHLYWLRCPGKQTCQLPWCLLGGVALYLAVCCSPSWLLSFRCWFGAQSSRLLLQRDIASLVHLAACGEKANVVCEVQVLQLLREGPLDTWPLAWCRLSHDPVNHHQENCRRE